jgi:hypothetical protein
VVTLATGGRVIAAEESIPGREPAPWIRSGDKEQA